MKYDFKGLNDEQIEKSRKENGSNALTPVETESFMDKLKENLKDPIIRILIFALVLNVVFYFMGKGHWYEALGIAVAVALATFISTWSEYSNEESFQKLQEEASKISSKVFRNDEITSILIDDIVKGEYVLLQPGDKVPADGYLISGDIKADQASLTGESIEVEKLPTDEQTALSNSTDLSSPYNIYRGTTVLSGEGVAVITSVGDNTVYGSLAQEMKADDRPSPLKLKLSNLADFISKAGYLFAGLIFASYMINKIFIHNNFDMALISAYFTDLGTLANDIVTAIILAVIIIVVAVPEGLPMMIAMVLSLNMKKMLKDNILVRKLIGIETAGSLNLLFSDKTGTITKGILEAVLFIDGDKNEYKSFEELPKKLSEYLDLSLKKNTNAIIKKSGNNIEVLGGNSTEKALLRFVAKSDKKFENFETVDTMPFSSDKKFSATQIKGDMDITLIKGAGERIVDYCNTCYDENGNIVEFTKKEQLIEMMNELSAKSIRLLGVATTNSTIDDMNFDSKDMTLVGVFGIRDDLRQESVYAIKEAMDAGIQVVMITGDRKETAQAIAKDAGLIKNDSDIAITSDDLNVMSDDEIKKILPNIRVIARALPTDKSRLVKIAQEMDLVVGMTGDGVNDSPALKKADVGFAMGSGTEVAKEAGDIVILDDNFLSITKAILYGRTIFHSIRKFIVFQLTINVAALLIAFIGPFIGVELPLTMTQMLWVNLVMDTLAALAFGGEPALERYMKEKPKSRRENIISSNMKSEIAVGGLYVAAMSIFFLKSPAIRDLFRDGTGENTDIYFLTGFFTMFIFVNVFNAFNARTSKMNLFDNIHLNQSFIKIMAFIAIVQVILTYFGGSVLRTAGLNSQEWIVVIAMAFTIIPIDLIRKMIFKNKY